MPAKAPCMSIRVIILPRKRALISAKDPWISTKEPCMSAWTSIHAQKSPMHPHKSPHIRKRASCVLKRALHERVYMRQRDLCIRIGALISAKEPYVFTKEPCMSAWANPPYPQKGPIKKPEKHAIFMQDNATQRNALPRTATQISCVFTCMRGVCAWRCYKLRKRARSVRKTPQKSPICSQQIRTCAQKSPACPYDWVYIRKRALHICKRALYIRKRALNTCKKSPTCLTMSAYMYPQKKLVYPQLSSVHSQKSPI